MKIAFRKTNAPGFFAGLFNAYTKWSLKTDYAHGGVVIDGKLWHTTRKGLKSEDFCENGWDLFETPISDKIALERLKKYESIRYDVFSLMGFKLPFRISDSNALYCFEVLWIALTGENPAKPISPDTVMAQLLRLMNEKSNEIGGDTVIDDDGNGVCSHPIGCQF